MIEGTDGSGKGTQFELLKVYLGRKGINFRTLDFPQYGKYSAYFIEKYLNGGYGKNVDPKIASLFYALDRYEMRAELKSWLEKGIFVLANRYVASNMGHQGAKFKNLKARREFIRWVHSLEFGILKMPKPDLNIVLEVPPKIAYRLLNKKEGRSYLRGRKRDIHEADINHLNQAYGSYRDTVRSFPREFVTIDCAPKRKLLSIDEIHARVVELVQRYANA